MHSITIAAMNTANEPPELHKSCLYFVQTITSQFLSTPCFSIYPVSHVVLYHIQATTSCPIKITLQWHTLVHLLIEQYQLLSLPFAYYIAASQLASY